MHEALYRPAGHLNDLPAATDGRQYSVSCSSAGSCFRKRLDERSQPSALLDRLPSTDLFCQGTKGLASAIVWGARTRRFPRRLEGLTMTKPMKTKTDLFAVLEDDIKQFRDALFGVLRAAPQQITLAIRRGLGTKDRQTSGQAIADRSRPMD